MLFFSSDIRESGSARKLSMRRGLFPWLISATRTLVMTPGTDACITSSNVSATAANMSGLMRPHTMPRKVFIHSTDSGSRFAVAVSPLDCSLLHSISRPLRTTSFIQRKTPDAKHMPNGMSPFREPPNILPSITTARSIAMQRAFALVSRDANIGS